MSIPVSVNVFLNGHIFLKIIWKIYIMSKRTHEKSVSMLHTFTTMRIEVLLLLPWRCLYAAMCLCSAASWTRWWSCSSSAAWWPWSCCARCTATSPATTRWTTRSVFRRRPPDRTGTAHRSSFCPVQSARNFVEFRYNVGLTWWELLLAACAYDRTVAVCG